ncbi:MAG: hypothetical protein KME40_04925 [Komarekiella atlantica HA4396-MV6]|nr:hypothetical protein [Komarekiella atlantica HA4396-MV6]
MGTLRSRSVFARRSSDACLEKLSHCVGRVSRLVASGVPRLGNPPKELFALGGLRQRRTPGSCYRLLTATQCPPDEHRYISVFICGSIEKILTYTKCLLLS